MTYEINYANSGTISATNATVTLTLPSPSVYLASAGTTYSVGNPLLSGDDVTWTLPTLPPGASGRITVKVKLACAVTLSPQITALAQIHPITGDGNPADNSALYNQQALCSYDPNDKTVTPAGCGPQGLIKATDSLTYKVRFQNLGTAPAYHVVVRDTLDTDLDIQTVSVLGTSHPATLEIDGRELKWTFWGIELQAASQDEPASHGYIDFKVKQMPGNPVGTVIENDASIYFDLNEAVLTNTTINTVTAEPLPVASFTHKTKCSGDGCSYDFKYTGGTPGTTYLWDFGPDATPQTSTQKNPEGVAYSTSGLKIPTLKVALGACQVGPAYSSLLAEASTTEEEDCKNRRDERFGMHKDGTFWYSIKKATSIDVKLTDVHGRQVSRLFIGSASPGSHTAKLNTTGLKRGAYVLVVQTGDGQREKIRVVLTSP